MRKATAKKEQKIKPENHAPRKRGVIAIKRFRARFSLSEFFKGAVFGERAELKAEISPSRLTDLLGGTLIVKRQKRVFCRAERASEAQLFEVPRGNPKGKTDPATE
ncbi:MAG: hypothetical protein Q8P01_03610 [bacterium]|nr:hypothetical protein [bacterium]